MSPDCNAAGGGDDPAFISEDEDFFLEIFFAGLREGDGDGVERKAEASVLVGGAGEPAEAGVADAGAEEVVTGGTTSEGAISSSLVVVGGVDGGGGVGDMSFLSCGVAEVVEGGTVGFEMVDTMDGSDKPREVSSLAVAAPCQSVEMSSSSRRVWSWL